MKLLPSNLQIGHGLHALRANISLHVVQSLKAVVLATVGFASIPVVAQEVVYEHNFSSGLGIFSDAGRVTMGSYGVRLRGGASSSIVSSAITIGDVDTVTISYSRSMSGLDAGETAVARYSFNGVNFTDLESVRSGSGAISYDIPANGSQLYLQFSLNASSYFESYTISSVTIESENGDPGDPGDPGNCSANSLSPGETNRTLYVNGTRRSYILNVPRSYNGQTPVPLVLDFHPLSADADYQRDNSGTNSLSEQEGFIVAYPDGIDNAWNFGPCCTESRSVDDVGFARQVVEDISANGCIDESRVYAMGYSNGGGLSHYLACNAADMVAAVAPAAFDLVEEAACNPIRPISVYMSRGRFDFIVPFDGGRSTPPTGYNLDPIHFLGAEETFNEWGDINSCSSTTSLSSSCDLHRNCDGGVEVVLCTERFGGHSGWDAGEAWDFLKTQSLD
ncbi:CE1 family esterase [Aurantivibrio plasticivorans]